MEAATATTRAVQVGAITSVFGFRVREETRDKARQIQVGDCRGGFPFSR